jgi:hypothetical protein
MAHESDAALERLEALVGRWKTEGQTTDAAGGDRIDAIDTYERLPGGALLHLVDAQVGDQKVEGAEVIGYDPDRTPMRRSTSAPRGRPHTMRAWPR